MCIQRSQDKRQRRCSLTCDNFVGRSLKDPDVEKKVEQEEEKYGNEMEEWQLKC